ncbi:sugar transferase [Shimia aestuarii]|uniref:Sugar transferase involved in LPS biosynthesis (Colanic, teichoic acid) n=1 Tax=Shimia aestuarii TaxID=254406 RepID=A0A1I4TT60_9RHOB|nr:sugar transferase [Shimia aestuarii]SFM79767.1 Sugar transferase involved in LPS biosynthesis (colanic, teichoic acid) [Shimia aestuarii]
MTLGRRVMDIVLALLLLAVLWPVLIVLVASILILDGRPVLYISERMRTPEQGFNLWKFRTMINVATDSGVSGGDKAHRITRTGAVMRRYRLDEIPQLWNILKGDIGFVGPRPPLRRYVERFPAIYVEVLKDRPGVTGLATLIFHRTEERLLAGCSTPEETEAVYERRCIPVKARLDLIYANNRNLCLDLRMMVATVFRRIPPVPHKRP